MELIIRSADEVSSELVRLAVESRDDLELGSPEVLAQLVRRVASFKCPTTNRELAKPVLEALKGLVETPAVESRKEDVWYTYTVRVDRRDNLRQFLSDRGIETKIHHPILMPCQPVYRKLGNAGNYPVASRMIKRIVSLPATEKIKRVEIDYVVESIRKFYEGV